MKRILIVLAFFQLQDSLLHAVDPTVWEPTLGDLVKTEKAGFGGLCGVVVDPVKGTVWINLSDRGFFRSDDMGKTFLRCSAEQPKGRTETPGCFALDPRGKSQRMMTTLVYGSPVSVSEDHGINWKPFDTKSSHVDWCAVDWTDADLKFVLALKHESNGLLLMSRDGGASFSEVGKGFGTGWIFDNKTAVVAEVKTRD